jgi:2-dehydro-3-deoxyphosphogluconate aldolase / (4S)-4-hydroxy-2-oxoglutarate aldolase
MNECTVKKIANRITSCGLIPIVRFETLEQAAMIVSALHDAGVDIVEFPLTSRLALAAIEKISDEWGDSFVVGAGTVLDAGAVRSCSIAGARFIVSPVVEIDVISACKKSSLVSFPGAMTPTEAFIAWKNGADFIKIFPCGNMGGVSYINALRTPFPEMKLVPVGGVTIRNVADFIMAGCPAVGVGSGLVDIKVLETSGYENITAKAAGFINAVCEARKILHP